MKTNTIINAILVVVVLVAGGCSLRDVTADYAVTGKDTVGSLGRYYTVIEQADTEARKSAHLAIRNLPKVNVAASLASDAGVGRRYRLLGAIEGYTAALSDLTSAGDADAVAGGVKEITASFTAIAAPGAGLFNPVAGASVEKAGEIFGGILGEIISGHFRYLQDRESRKAVQAANAAILDATKLLESELLIWGLVDEALWANASDNNWIHSTGLGGIPLPDAEREANFNRIETFAKRARSAGTRAMASIAALQAFAEAQNALANAILDNRRVIRDEAKSAIRNLGRRATTLSASLDRLERESARLPGFETILPPELVDQKRALSGCLHSLDGLIDSLVRSGEAEDILAGNDRFRRRELRNLIVARNAVDIAIAGLYARYLRGYNISHFDELTARIAKVETAARESQEKLDGYKQGVANAAEVMGAVSRVNQDIESLIHLISENGIHGMDVSTLLVRGE